MADAADKKLKKKKKAKAIDTSAADAPAVDAAAGTAASEPSRKGKKRKNPDAPAPAAVAPTPLEEHRRRAQREIQQLVVRLRAEGKSKHEIDAAKRDHMKFLGNSFRQPDGGGVELVNNSFRKPDGARAKKVEEWKAKQTEKAAEAEKAGKEVEDKRKEGLEHKHDIVVIPVTWRGRHDHQEIEKAAGDVKAFLAQQGLDVWVDSRRQYTPGQKFAHWEFRGVMLRIEIGPEDFEAGKMRVCKAKEAGDYKSVEKKRLNLPPRGGRKLLLALKEWGLTQLDIEHRPGDDESDEDEPAVAAAKTAAAKEEEDLGGNWAPRILVEKGKKKKRRTA